VELRDKSRAEEEGNNMRGRDGGRAAKEVNDGQSSAESAGGAHGSELEHPEGYMIESNRRQQRRCMVRISGRGRGSQTH
jgi:hypothetical protein